ncbi:MAG TPA: cobalamin-binding protein [Gemmatimonadales bacterium]
MRVASLLASATEIVCALGLEDRLVAISHECDYPPAILDRPRVSRPRFRVDGLTSGQIDAAVRGAMATHGGVYELDEPALRAARPDLILTQQVCEVCAVPTSLARAAAAALDDGAVVLSLDAHTIEGILDSVLQIAGATGASERGAALVAGWRDRLRAVEAAVRGAEPPRTLAVEWLDPVFTPGHWVPEMISLAGGANLAGTPARRSAQVDWADLADLDPDVLLVMPCGYGLAQSRAEADAHADRLRALAPRAVAGGKAFVLDGSAYFNRSGPRIVDGVEILAALLHPDRVADVALEGRAARWMPLESVGQ